MDDNEIIARYKKYEPFFGNWYLKRFIGEGSFAKVFEIVRNDFGSEYVSALKIITVSKNKTEIDAMKAEGMTDEDIRMSLREIVEDTVKEIQLMYKLKGNTNIVGYEDHAVIEHEDGMGWDILIKMEYLTSLGGYIRQQKGRIAKQDVIKLGIDICKALEACQKYNIIHRDIKADNVFVSENGKFKLGDFGIARMVERNDMELSKKGTSAYMAPEVYKGNTYTSAVDIYSLGIVLYRLLNNNRFPFLPPYPKPVSLDDRDKALMLRMSGTPLPRPSQVNKGRLPEIVLKACAYRPEDRYSSPIIMQQELETILYKQDEMTTDEMIVVYEEQVGTEGFSNTGITGGSKSRQDTEYEATEILREEVPLVPPRREPSLADTPQKAPAAAGYTASAAAASGAVDSKVKILCKNCGNAIDHDAAFCPVCGADQTQRKAGEAPAGEGKKRKGRKSSRRESAAAPRDGKKRKGRRRPLLIAGIAAALCIVVGVLIATDTFSDEKVYPIRPCWPQGFTIEADASYKDVSDEADGLYIYLEDKGSVPYIHVSWCNEPTADDDALTYIRDKFTPAMREAHGAGLHGITESETRSIGGKELPAGQYIYEEQGRLVEMLIIFDNTGNHTVAYQAKYPNGLGDDALEALDIAMRTFKIVGNFQVDDWANANPNLIGGPGSGKTTGRFEPTHGQGADKTAKSEDTKQTEAPAPAEPTDAAPEPAEAVLVETGAPYVGGTFGEYQVYEETDGTYSYVFPRLKISMDENWYRKTKAVVADGGASVSFYHKGSNEAYAAEGMEGAGLLLTIGASVNSDFQNLPDFTYLGFDEEEMMNYYAACPTDYQAYMGDETIRAEYDELNSKVSGVINSAQLTS